VITLRIPHGQQEADTLQACWTAIIAAINQCIALGPETVRKSMHDLPVMAVMMRQREETLRRVGPFPVDI
jgi:hypothetical protein